MRKIRTSPKAVIVFREPVLPSMHPSFGSVKQRWLTDIIKRQRVLRACVSKHSNAKRERGRIRDWRR